MGQQDSKPQIGAVSSPKNINYHTKKSESTQKKKRSNYKFLECDGLLKLQSIPFKNCVEIQTQNEILFLQNVEITLKYLLEGRLNTNKLFTIQDIQKLIQALTFTLAFMQQHAILYKDIHPENIFYDHGNFKLLPNQLIELNSYQKFKENGDIYPSPQYIIALRCGQQDITDDDIIEKSNVFILGMILLQVTTLLPSIDCYDSQNFDILDTIINERITLVEEYYGQKVAKIIANMLDYDYTERMNLKELSIWVNRQLHLSKVSDNSIVQNHNHITSINMSKVEKQVEGGKLLLGGMSNCNEKVKGKGIKSNSIYMDFKRQNESNRQDRNKVYAKDNQIRFEQPNNRSIAHDQNRYLKRNQSRTDNTSNIHKPYERQIYNQMDNFKPNENISRPLKSNQIYQQKDSYNYNIERRESNMDKSINERQTATKRIAKDQLKLFRNQQDQSLNGIYIQKRSNENSLQDKAILRQIGNQFYPKVDELFKNKAYCNDELKGGMNENGSLNRIKQQILKSRKLIEQFKRSQGLKY